MTFSLQCFFFEICSFSFECLIFVSVSRMVAFSFWKYTVSEAYLTFIAFFVVEFLTISRSTANKTNNSFSFPPYRSKVETNRSAPIFVIHGKHFFLLHQYFVCVRSFVLLCMNSIGCYQNQNFSADM